MKKLGVSCSQVNCVNATLTLPFNEEKAFKNGPHLKNGNLSLQDILKKAYRDERSFAESNTTNKIRKNSKQKTSLNDNIEHFFSKKLSQKIDTYKISDSTDCEISSPVVTFHISSSESCSSEIINSETTEQTVQESVLDKLQLRRKKIKTVNFDMDIIKKYIESKSKYFLICFLHYFYFIL